MACSVCDRSDHNAATCPHDGERRQLPPECRRSRRCECCGQCGYKIHRHHTRGRGDDSDYLDVCVDCHLTCCHDGDYYNLAIKPRVCRISGSSSYWR